MFSFIRGKILFAMLLTVVANTQLLSQFSEIHFGGQIGIGATQGESISQTSLSGSMLLGFKTFLTERIAIRIKYLAARKVNYFLPENRTKTYYPWMQSISLLGNIDQYLENNFLIEEGLGVAFLNDRTFRNLDEWDIGIIIHVMIGWDLRNYDMNGFKIGFGGELAETFTNTTASYYMFTFQTYYYF